jgi:hypothetical protein
MLLVRFSLTLIKHLCFLIAVVVVLFVAAWPGRDDASVLKKRSRCGS